MDARRGADGGSTLTFVEPGRFSATALVSSDGLVTQVDSVFPDPVMGDTRTVTTYSDYRDVAGIKFPMRIRQTMGGFPVLDMTVEEVQANADTAALQVPDAARNQGERVTAEKVAEGTWFLGGGSHNSVAIEMRDHLVLVETPLNDVRTQAVIAQAKAQEGKRLATLAVADKLAMGDASRPIELHRITDNVHRDSFLMVYLPNEKLCAEVSGPARRRPRAAAIFVGIEIVL